MNKYDLSILIPARNEMFLAETVKNILRSIRGNTEVIVVLDGQWAFPALDDDPRLTIVYFPEAIGQRAATNQACRLSKAKYVMKLDAHCTLDEGFDVKLIADMQDDWTMIPTMYNLHAFDWVCVGQNEVKADPYSIEPVRQLGCGYSIYQGPTPPPCIKCGGKMVRELVFKPRLNRKSNYYRFDKELHFQYWGKFGDREENKGDLVELMTIQGSCFMLTREKYWELDICEEALSGKTGWGQQGVEVALKTWLSGGKVMLNKKTWYSHMFRTQGGDFGFPYPMSGKEVGETRRKSQDLFKNDKWKGIIPGRSFQWVLDKFAPIPDWHEEPKKQSVQQTGPTKGIIFYTDNKVNLKMAHAVQKQLKSIGIPISSSSLKPMPHFGQNVHLPLERGYLTMFKQQLAALEQSKEDIVFMCEHDVLYHPSHFKFTPPEKDKIYYNTNVWKVDAKSGHALWVNNCRQVSGVVAYRETLVAEYKRRVERVEREGRFERGWGFEPGTKSIARGGFSDLVAVNFESEFPNIDIRADHNLTPNRWRKDQFRNQSNTEGWTESDITQIKGWNFTRKEGFYTEL